MIDKFRGKYFFLSNFYVAPVEYQGLTYQNNEAAFQSAKAKNKKDKEKFIDLLAAEAKKLGRQIELRDDWEDVKIDVMHEVCMAKFTQNLLLKEKLLATGIEELVEGNNHGDTFWGCVDGKGENHLGKILMKVREELS